MSKPIFTGAGVAIITPFKENGVDFEKLGELIDFQVKEGIDSLIICGTTGEASTMPDDEHKSVIKFAVDRVNKKIPVIAGTGSNDTNHAIDLSKYAEKVGADAILTVTPYYNKTNQKGLYKHFKAIADSVKIPVVLYNVPGRTNLNIEPETVKDLSQIDNIVAIKECNIEQVADIINLCDDDFAVYSGNDNLALPLLSLGGKGLVSVMANVIPKQTHDMVDKYLSGDTEGARKIQLKYMDLINAFFMDVSPIPLKEAMNLMGMNVGNCRLPLVGLEEEKVAELKNVLKKYELI
ncbi:4-hydroxy-tetrahydrodipicolinate synthase [Herbivorax sp. ANBcel31]|uniref:4-hydroxy-tetrahydrodipicolinate synthase n=1 Tax=Herbivorax sp. ANBcel31 TaxID=3069754 RepID=UPI0027B6C1F0|nr:4-hydroxy-tetrahydrodipicolinate synthase [Herbivorax sp. ANBcel31]MDQ2085221.1 4-hydroxy-tetrahydrodipicolinate synthase [Herbivorax sp. ANBcel31]